MKKQIRFTASLVQIALFSTLLTMILGGSPLLFAGILLALGAVKFLVFGSKQLDNTLAYDLVISDTTYAGEAAAQFIAKALTGNETIAGGHVYVKDSVKKKFTIPRWDMNYEDLIQDRQATPTSKGDQTITGQVLEPEDFMIYNEFNPRDFEDHWFASQIQGSTLLDSSLPASVESFMIQQVMQRVGKFVNRILWSGNKSLTTVYKYFDGFKTKATAASGTLKTGSTTTITSSNVATELGKGYALIPDALKYDTGMKIFCNYNTYDLYMQYQIAQANKGVDITQMGVPTFRGLPVVKIADMPNDYYMIAKGKATPESNLWVGVNSRSDENTLQLSRLQANSELFFVKGLIKMDAQIGWNEETITYE